MKFRSIILSIFALVVLAATVTVSGNSSGAIKHFSPRDNATVTVDFDGLMALCFGDQSRVSVGILNAHNHHPEISIYKIKDGARSTVAILDEKQLHGTLTVSKESGNNAVSRYYADSMDDQNDSRWVIDLENDLFQRALHLREDKFAVKIHFNDGLFYAGKQTERPVHFFAADNSGKTLPFFRRIADPAAKINLAIGDALVISGIGEPIKLVAEPGASYEMSVHNLPPPDMASMDHFIHYYDVINDQVTPYVPVMTMKAAYVTFPLICGGVAFGKSKLQ
jgi:hypothetical protein